MGEQPEIVPEEAEGNNQIELEEVRFRITGGVAPSLHEYAGRKSRGIPTKVVDQIILELQDRDFSDPEIPGILEQIRSKNEDVPEIEKKLSILMAKWRILAEEEEKNIQNKKTEEGPKTSAEKERVPELITFPDVDSVYEKLKDEEDRQMAELVLLHFSERKMTSKEITRMSRAVAIKILEMDKIDCSSSKKRLKAVEALEKIMEVGTLVRKMAKKCTDRTFN